MGRRGGDEHQSPMLRLIDKATDSTDRDVDSRLLSAIKAAARDSDDDIRVAAHVLMEKMKKEHSQVRYLALLINDELFMRSKLFRTLLVANLEQFLSLSIGFRRNMPLPPPASIASLLRSKSIEFLEKWNNTFGIHYRQLRLGIAYLKNTLKFQFPNRLENEARLQRERRKREMRSKEILLNKFENLKDNYLTIKSEIHSSLDQINECLDIARIERDSISQDTLADDDSEIHEFKCSALRQIRIDSLKEGKVHENLYNRPVFDALRELYKLLTSKHLTSVQECISILVRVDLSDNTFRDTALKELIDIRNLICSAKDRCEEAGCIDDYNPQDEDLWEEGVIKVPEPQQTTPPENKNENSTCDSITYKNKGKAPFIQDASTSGSGMESASPRSRLLAEAPVVPWGSSFDNWGANRDALANQRGLDLESHWGRVDPDAVIPADKIAELNFHVTTYEEPDIEIRPCLAPLKKGGLCQRKDLRVCPFHGPIVPRDLDGNPIEQLSPKETNLDDSPKQAAAHLKAEAVLESSNELVKELAEQAVRNVREKDVEVKVLKRAKLAKVRQHNEAVLRSAAVASSSYSEGFGEDPSTPFDNRPEAKRKKPTLASMLRKEVKTKDRLVKKLLSSRVTDATIRQLRQGEDAAYKEAYPNQW